MIVLGITDSFTSGAAVVIDGKVVAAVNEERLDRNKMCMGFPNLSITEVLRLAGVQAREVDAVAVATRNLFWRPRCVPYTDYFREKKGGFRDQFLSLGANLSTVVGNSRFARRSYYNLKALLTRGRRRLIVDTLRRIHGVDAPVRFLDHHLCHAASAYYTSGLAEATVITQDGAGDGKCSRVYRVRDGRFEPLFAMDSYDSVGNYYSYVTHLCGFKAHKHEGKITGLAANGQPVHLDLLRRFVRLGEGTIHNIGRGFDHSAIRKLERELGPGFDIADLSASVQRLLEETVTAYCDHWVRRSGIADIALAGGVFANVRLNQCVHELESVRSLFVHPGMGDDGLAVGAALHDHGERAGHRPTEVIGDVYLGAGFDEGAIRGEIERQGLTPESFSGPIEDRVAELLAVGHVVARFDGRMEYGPRALGNRSILYQATDPSVNDWLNKRLCRTEFMPFAPVTDWDERERWYDGMSGAEHTARFMTITFDCTAELKNSCPAVCHVDGTARPQLIRKDDNPSYHRILASYRKKTGLPCLINTSFNMHEEPIVHTPEDAIRSFLQGHLDFLAIGPFLLRDPSGEPRRDPP